MAGKGVNGDRRFTRKNIVGRKAQLRYMYIRKLMNMCYSRFKWEGLPNTITSRFIEQTLVNDGLVVFYRRVLKTARGDVEGYLALPAAASGTDVYGDPTEYQIVAGNGAIHDRLRATECVPIWCDYSRTPDLDIITSYAERLADMDMTILSDVITVRHPILMAGDEAARLSVQNMWRQLQEGEPAIFAYESAFEDIRSKLQALDTGVRPDQIVDLQLAKTKMWNECLNLLGVNSANQDKKERLVEAETAANDDIISIARGTYLDARREAVDRINAKYGLSLNVSWRDNEVTADQPGAAAENQGMEEGF